MEIGQSFLDDPDASLTMTDVRRWIGEAKREGAAAERANIRREIWAWMEGGFRQESFTAALDRICPAQDKDSPPEVDRD